MSFGLLRSFANKAQGIFGLVCVSAAVFFAFGQPVFAATGINNQISYQARLLDPSGFPVADGTYNIKISLYDAPTGGTRLWTANGTTVTPTSMAVSVENGLFTVLLGDTGQNTLDTVDWNSDSVYLGITIESDSEMTPRRRLASAPQAFNARQLQGMYASGTAFGANTVFTVNQTSNTAATGTRSAFDVRSSGTSNANDFLIRGINDLSSTVFSVNRQGNVTSTGVLAANTVTTSQLFVAGSLVCLSNGTNCTSGTDQNWTYNLLSDFVRNATATSDIVLGSTATSTGAAAYFDLSGGTNGTSTFYFGHNTNTNIVLGGTSTTNTGLNAAFVLSGDDLFVHGNIGSVSSVYTNGEFVAGPGSTHYGDGTINKTDGILSIQASSHVQLFSSGGGKVFVGANGISSVTLADVTFGGFTLTDLLWANNNTNDIGSAVSSVRNVYVSSTLRAGTVSTTNLFATNVTFVNVSATTVTTTNLIATSGTIATLNGGTLNFETLNVYGNSTLGNNSGSDQVAFISTINSDIFPTTNDLYNLGQVGQAWHGGYFVNTTSSNIFGNAARVNNLVVASSTVTSSLTVLGAMNYYPSTNTNPLTVHLQNTTNTTDFAYGLTIASTNTNRGINLFRFNNFDDFSGLAFADDVSTMNASGSVMAFDHTRDRYSVALYGASGLSSSVAEFRIANLDAGDPNENATYMLYGNNSNSSTAILYLKDNGGGGIVQHVGTTTPEGTVYANAGSIFFNSGGLAAGTQAYLKTTNGGSTGWVGIATTDMVGGGGSDTNWTFNLSGNFVRNATSTTDLVFGSTATSTGAPAYFDLSGAASGTSNFFFGFNTSSNVFVGGSSTTLDFLNYNFALSGKSLFVGDSIASVSSVFTNGEFASGPGGQETLYGNGFLNRNDGSFFLTTNSPGTQPSISFIAGTGTSSAGGDVNIIAGNSVGGGPPGGNIVLRPGDSTFGTPGDVYLLNAGATNQPRLRFNSIGGGITSLKAANTAANTTFTLPSVAGASSSALLTDASGVLNFISVCLTDGTNCPSSFSTDLNWTYTLASNSVRNATATTDIVLGSSATSTGAPAYFDLSGGTNGTSTFYFGHSTNTNVIIGGTSTTVGFMSPLFSLNGNDLFVGGNIGSVSSVYTNGAFVAGTGTTMFGDGYITKTNGKLTLTASQNIVAASRLDALYLNRWFDSPLLKNSVYGGVNATATAGSGPAGVAFDGSYIWVANYNSNTVSKIDVTTNAVVATTTVGSSPSGVAFDGGYVWVTNSGSNTVSKIDVTTNAVVATTTVGTSPFDIAFDGNFMWVVNNGTNNVSKISISTNAVVATTTVGSSPQSIAFDGSHIWVSNGLSNTVSKIDVTTNAVVATTAVGGNPYGIAFDGSHLWVANNGPDNVSKIDINTNAVVATTTVGTDPNFVTFDGYHIWVTNFSSNNVSKIDINTNAVVATLPVGTNPGGIAFDGNHIWVANYSSNNVSKLPIGGGNGTNMQLNLNLTSSGNIYTSGTVTIANALTQTWSTASSPRQLSHATLSTSGKVGEVIGNFEYVADGTKLNIYDISDPNNVNLVKQLSLGESLTTTIAHDGHTLYVRGSSHTFFINVESPADAVVLAQPTNPPGTTSIWRVQNGYLYTTRCFGFCPSGNELVIYKINGTTLTEVGSLSDVVDTDLTVVGRTLYALDNQTDFLYSIDVSDPTAPTILGSLDLSAGSPSLVHLAVSGRYAYVVDSFNGYLITVDVSDVANLSLAQTLSGFTSPSYIAVSGRYAYVSDNASPSVVRVVDVQTTSSQSIVNSIQTGTDSILNFIPVGRYGTLVQIGSSNDGLYAYDLQGTEVANLTAHNVNTGGLFVQGKANFADAVQVQSSLNVGDAISVGGQLVCLQDGTNCQTASPTVYLTVATSTPTDLSNPIDTYVVGKYMYVLDNGDRTLKIYDVSDAANPSETGSVSVTYSGSPSQLVVSGDYAYVTINSASHTLDIVDISNPASPSVVGVQGFNASNDPSDVAVSGTYAYVTTGGNNVAVINVATPSAPVSVATTTVGTLPAGIKISGNYAYVANFSSDNMSVLDISNPASPSVVATLSGLAQPVHLDVANGYAYVANSQFGNDTMAIVDIHDPTNPSITTSTFAGIGPYDIAVAGHYAYVTYTHSGSKHVAVIDITDALHPKYISTNDVGYSGYSISISGRYAYMANYSFQARVTIAEINGDDTTDLYAVNGYINGLTVHNTLTVGGQLVCLANGTNCPAGGSSNLQAVTDIGASTTNQLYLFRGFTAASSTVTSTFTVLGSTSLQDLTFQRATGVISLTVTGNTSSTQLNVLTGVITNLTGTAMTSTNIAGTVVTTSQLFVGGQTVCLVNGTNCPTSDANWTYSLSGNFIRNTTSTTDLVLGSTATSTGAPAYFDLHGGTSGSSDFYFGFSTSSNVLIGGTSTSNTGLNGSFALDGDDLFVHGNIGSASSVYTNGEFVAGPGSTHFGDGYIYSLTGPINIYSASASGTQFTNSINNTLTTQTTFRTTSSTQLSGTFPIDVVVQGHFAYVVNQTDNTISVVDVTYPTAPIEVAHFTSNSIGFGDPRGIAISGRYLFVANEATGQLSIFDISRPSAPVLVGEQSSLANPFAVAIQGNRAWVLGSGGLLYAVDISNPSSPVLKSTTTISTGSYNIVTQGSYAYISNANFTFSVVDIASSTPNVVGTGVTHGSGGKSIRVSGNYLLTGASGSSTVDVFSINNPTSPTLIGSVLLGSSVKGNGNSVFISGRYGYAITNSGINVIDLNNPFNPSVLLVYAVGANPNGIFVAGRYAYVPESTANKLYVVDTSGVETNGLLAASADLGTLQVEQNASIYNNASIGGSLSVGSGGIFSQGLFSSSVSSTSSSASFINYSGGTLGTEWGAYINKLLVGSNANATGSSNYKAVFTYASGTSSMGVCIDDTATAAGCPATGFGGASLLADGLVGSNAFDLAETYTVNGSANPGDVLVMDATASSTVKVADGTAYDGKLIGVVSTDPGFLLGWNAGARVALAGHVPTHVSLENGEIHIGDPLTSSHTPGYAMKATKPGRIIGYALEDASATGTITVFVHAGYSAGGVIGNDGTLTTVNDNLVLGASATVNASSTTANSWGLTFRGQAWDASSTSVVNRDFTLMTDVISATSSAFTIRNASGTDLFSIDQDGNASVNGDLQVGGKLYLSSRGSKQNDYYVFLDQAASSTYIGTNADGFQSLDTYDFAERFYSPDALEPGDLVVVKDVGGQHVQRSFSANEMLVGIVSTRPAFVAGRPATDTYPIALTGRVPTKVSNMSGAIKAGDPLAPSTMPGVAVKATKTGPIVGLALEDFDDAQVGLISVYVNPGWWTSTSTEQVTQTVINNNTTVTGSETSSQRRGLAKIEAGASTVHVSYDTINAYPFVQVTPRGLINGSWGTDHYTDRGFDILLSQPQSFDAFFSWQVQPLDTGDRLFQSDGTYLDLNQMTGDPIGGQVATSTDASPTSTETGTQTISSTAVTTTSTDSVTSSTDPVAVPESMTSGDTVAASGDATTGQTASSTTQ